MAKQYVVKVENGNVKIFKQNGDFIRHLCGNAKSAELKGDEVYVTTKGNNVKIYSVNGFYKKTI